MIFTQAAINAEADKAGAAGNSDLMAKLKSAATNKKIQGAFMDVKNNGASAAMKYKDDGRGAAWKSIATRYTPSTRCWPRESVGSMAWDSLVYLRTAEVTGILKDVFMS